MGDLKFVPGKKKQTRVTESAGKKKEEEKKERTAYDLALIAETEIERIEETHDLSLAELRAVVAYMETYAMLTWIEVCFSSIPTPEKPA